MSKVYKIFDFHITKISPDDISNIRQEANDSVILPNKSMNWNKAFELINTF